MLKLFAVLLGGRAEGCNIELHDVVFVVARSIEDSYPTLVDKWFGTPNRLHIDSFIELDFLDGYEISVSDKLCQNEASLFFINMGGYKENHFGEVHETSFCVSKTEQEATDRAKSSMPSYIYQQHCDDKLNIIELINVDGYFVKVKKSTNSVSKLTIKSEYRKLVIL